MEPLVINWAKEEVKMAKIFGIFMFIVNKKISKSIMQYLSQTNSAEGVLPDDEF